MEISSHDLETIKMTISLWNDTEVLIKKAEIIQRSMVVPAVSELRYAGRKLVDYLISLQDTNSEIDARNHIEEFKQCCIRARHDAIDAIVAYIDEYFNSVELDVGRNFIIDQFPEYQDCRILLKEIYNKIEETRRDRARRIDIYNDIITHDSQRAIEFYERMRLSEKLIYAGRKSVEALRRTRSLAFALAFITTAIAVSNILLYIVYLRA